MNNRSSRSHAIFTIIIEQRRLAPGAASVRTSVDSLGTGTTLVAEPPSADADECECVCLLAPLPPRLACTPGFGALAAAVSVLVVGPFGRFGSS